MKRIIAIALALLLALGAFSGCALVEEDDGNVVIAKVNGVAILKSEFNEVYDYYYNMFINYYGYDASTAVNYLEDMKEDILSDLIDQKVLEQLAEKEGYFNYTEEQKTAAQKVLDEDKAEYIKNFVEQYTAAFEGQTINGKNEGESDEDYFKRIAEEKYLADIKDSGTTLEEMLDEQLKSAALEKFQEDKLSGVTVLEADVVTKYNELYEEQKQEFTSDSIFVKAWNGQSITTSGGSSKTYDMIAYRRAGYSLVQHILISFEDEDLDNLEALYGTIAEYDEEIEGREKDIKDETDATKKAEHQAALDDAKVKRAEYQKKYDDAVAAAQAKIQTKVDEVYNKVKDADEATFIATLVEKTTDTGMNTEDAAKKGYLIGPEDGMVPEFSERGLSLEAGKVGEPVATYYGVHIIRCMEKLAEGKVPYEDLKDDINTQLTDEKKDAEWTKLLGEWTKAADIKKYTSKL